VILKPANLCEGCKVLHSSWPCCLDGLDLHRYCVCFTGRRSFLTEYWWWRVGRASVKWLVLRCIRFSRRTPLAAQLSICRTAPPDCATRTVLHFFLNRHGFLLLIVCPSFLSSFLPILHVCAMTLIRFVEAGHRIQQPLSDQTNIR
jgi:hypothetical protein